MGYTTDFTGSVSVQPPLNAAEADYLKRFAESRRFTRIDGRQATWMLAAAQAARTEAAAEQIAPSDRDWAENGSTCAHVCGPDPDHRCEAKATTTLEFAIPSGGKRRLPLCEPCNASELAATVALADEANRRVAAE